MNDKELSINTEEGTVQEQDVTKKPKMMSLRGLLSAISMAVSSGDMSTHEARKIRDQFGISQAFFTRSGRTVEQRKKKRKAQKIARRKNRGKTKGISIRKGQKFTPPKT